MSCNFHLILFTIFSPTCFGQTTYHPSPRGRNPKVNGDHKLDDQGLAHIIAINRLGGRMPKREILVERK